MKIRTIKDIDIKDKTVLVRVDFNVPIFDGRVESDLRIRAVVPTLELLREHGAKKIIIISHLGRPKGWDEELSLAPVAEVLDELVGKVRFVPEVYGIGVEEAVATMGAGEILVLENLRFFPGEEKNSREFAEKIVQATGAEIFVQDGFAVLHRAHASTAAITELLPSYAGLLVEKEVLNFEKVLEAPARPLVVVIGGAKVEDKAPLIEKFLGLADKIVVGGKIAADGYEAESDKIYVAEDFDETRAGRRMDIGPVATGKIADLIKDAKTVIWNGLLGKAEDPAYATASTIVAEVMGEKTGAETVICGGDTTGFVENLMLYHPELEYSLISTGGGASLEFLLGKELPGLVPLFIS